MSSGASNGNDAPIGVVIGGVYRLEAVLVDSPQMRVFRARDVTSDAVAVARCPMPPAGLVGPELTRALAAFDREATLLARVSESSVDVERLLAHGVAQLPDGSVLPFCVFEWLDGRPLEIPSASGPGLSLGEGVMLLEPAARALAAAHALGASHGNVRPARLVLATSSARTSLRLVGFGLASCVGEAPGFSPEYGAPEQFHRTYGKVGPPTDVYGLALTLVELVTGRRALEGNDASELYLASCELSRRPTPRARGAQVSDAVETVFARALAVDPRRRQPDARAFWDELRAALPELSPAALPAPAPVVAPAPTEDATSAASAAVAPTSPDGNSAMVPVTGAAESSNAARRPQAAWPWLAVAALGAATIGLVVTAAERKRAARATPPAAAVMLPDAGEITATPKTDAAPSATATDAFAPAIRTTEPREHDAGLDGQLDGGGR